MYALCRQKKRKGLVYYLKVLISFTFSLLCMFAYYLQVMYR